MLACEQEVLLEKLRAQIDDGTAEGQAVWAFLEACVARNGLDLRVLREALANLCVCAAYASKEVKAAANCQKNKR